MEDTQVRSEEACKECGSQLREKSAFGFHYCPKCGWECHCYVDSGQYTLYCEWHEPDAITVRDIQAEAAKHEGTEFARGMLRAAEIVENGP